MSAYMDMTTANPSLVTVGSSGEVTVTYDAYIKSNVARSSGKWYVEFRALVGRNVPHVGVAKESYSTPTKRTGAYANRGYDAPTVLNASNGNIYDGRGNSSGGWYYRNSAIAQGTLICMYIDMDNHTLRFSIGGVDYPLVRLAYNDAVNVVVSGRSSTTASAASVEVNLGGKPFQAVPSYVPLETKSFDGTRYAVEERELPFIEEGNKKYVMKKGLTVLKKPIRSSHTLDSMVKAFAESQYGNSPKIDNWKDVFTPYNLLNAYNDHKHDCWATNEGVRSSKVIFDFGRVNPMSGLRMSSRNLNHTTSGQGTMPTNFDIYGSIDGKVWTNIHEVRNSTGWSYGTVRDFIFTETFFYRFLKIDFLNTQASNASYLSVAYVSILVNELTLVEFDKDYLSNIYALGLEELDGIADQITSNKILIADEEFEVGSSKALGIPKGARSINLNGGEAAWEL